MTLRITAALAAAVALIFGSASAATAVPQLTGDLPAATAENQSVPLAFDLSGVDWTAVLVTIEVVEGSVTVDAAGVVSAAPGYDLQDATATRQSFNGPLADVQDTLANGITWITPAAAGSYTIDFSMTVQEYVPGLSFNPDNGHYYLVPVDEFGDPLTLSAEDAFAAADNGDFTYAGLTGYIAEINDDAENDFVANYSGGENIWIGASSEYTILNSFAGTSYADNTASNSKWHWVNSTVLFADGLGGDIAAVNGAYSSWADGEPNGGGGQEGCVVTNWEGAPALWNDLACDDTWTNSFIVEFDSADAGAAILELTDEDLQAAENSVNELAETGVNATLAMGLAGTALIAAAAVVVARRRARV